jgi:hypothetical protein
VQVWAKGDNYALRPEQRAGASFEHGGLGAPNLATDGVYDSEWVANTWLPIYEKGTAWWDLGAVFWVDNLFLVAKRINQSHQGAFLGHFILVSDGTLLKPITMESREDFPQLESGLDWDNIVSENHLDNHTPTARIVNENFPLRQIRYIMMRDIDITGSSSGLYGSLATLGELQLYGEGYPVSVWTYSPPIKLTDSQGNFIRKTLPRLSWEGEAIVRQTDPLTDRTVEVAEPLENHPEVRLQLQTRTSDQTDSTFKYYEVVSIEGNEERGEITKELYEDLVYDGNGQLLTTSFMDYILPTAKELPAVEVAHVETLPPVSVSGFKGMGEGGTLGATAAAANAVADALAPLGIRVDELPLTPDRIYRLMHHRPEAG